MRNQNVRYVHDETALEGILYQDDRFQGPGPGIMLIHGGAGLDRHAKDQAQRYATLGFAVFACDIFGREVAGQRNRIVESIVQFRDNPVSLVQRVSAGLDTLVQCVEVLGLPSVVGFCFGGLAALELARSGAELEGVVSIHGSLTTAKPAAKGSIKAKVLVCHGSADPHVPVSDVVAFKNEMDQAEADWQLIMYGRAMHGYTHKEAIPGASAGIEFDATSDERTFRAVGDFLAASHRPPVLRPSEV